MVRFGAATAQGFEMGQQSSQVDRSSGVKEDADLDANGSDKNRKSKKHKRKSADAEQALDPEEQESARTLLQMRAENGSLHHGDDLAASQQLASEYSHPPSQGLSYIDDPCSRISYGSRKHSKSGKNGKKQKKKQQQQSRDVSSFSHDEYAGSQYPQLPSTPPEETDHTSPSPFPPSASQPQHALDDVPTDDETAVFDIEFGKGSTGVEPAMPVQDIFSFSQQPADPENYNDSTYPEYQLPTLIHHPPKNSKKRKRDKSRTKLDLGTANESVVNGAGQHISEFDFDQGVFNGNSIYDMSFANHFDEHEGDDLPIDPELHSISALQPPADLSLLDGEHLKDTQSKTRQSKTRESSQPRKRRRIEEAHVDTYGEDSSNSKYTHTAPGDMQDFVLPGLEDVQGRTSPELGNPSMEGIARGGLEYLEDKRISGEGSYQNERKGGSTEKSGTQVEGSQKGKKSERSLKDVSEKGGPFSSDEMAKLDTFREKYCSANDIDFGRFNNLIQTPMRGNAEVTTLFNELHEVLPYRPRMSVQKYARRRFHNYAARGVWTAEEDKMLKQAVNEKGKSWKVVGEMVDRMPGDCRDRWRNYLFKSEHRNREQWTDEEVRNLCFAILDCTELMKRERQQAREEKHGPGAAEIDENPDQEAEDIRLINWQVVSDRMGEYGNGRSRLQCSLKWSQLKKSNQTQLLQTVRELQGLPVKKPAVTKNPWRDVRAAKKVANIRTGDRYTLLQAIASSNAPTEGNIPWKLLGDDGFRNIWSAPDKKKAWDKMKETVPNSGALDYREIVNLLLTRILAEGAMELDERWDPQVHGDVTRKRSKKSEKAKGKERERDGSNQERKGRYHKRDERERKAKSLEFVQESDDEDEADAVNEPQDYNRYNVLPRSEKATRYDDRIAPVASMTGDEGINGHDDGLKSDQDSLFDEPIDRSNHRLRGVGEVSPEMATRIHSLQFA